MPRLRPLLAVLTALAAAALAAAPASAYETHLNVSYDIDSPAAGRSNALDLYTPGGLGPNARRPLVVYVHGGGWYSGDKGNKIADKAALFTRLGYVFASVDYRLSPTPTGSPNADPDRVRFPDHPHDVGEAIGWLNRHVADYGGDPKRILLLGHSAGAQIISLVATDPSYVEAYGVEPWKIAGAISLDTDSFDIREQATQTQNLQNRALIWNGFATPSENAQDGTWAKASAILAADQRRPHDALRDEPQPEARRQQPGDGERPRPGPGRRALRPLRPRGHQRGGR